MQPPMAPVSMSVIEGSAPEGDAAFIRASGVAVETPSSVHEVMAAGQLASIMARPAKAGLTTLQPRPPKNCFTTKMAKTDPTAAIQ